MFCLQHCPAFLPSHPRLAQEQLWGTAPKSVFITIHNISLHCNKKRIIRKSNHAVTEDFYPVLFLPENCRWFAFLHWAPHHFIAWGLIFCNNWNVFESILSSCVQHKACQYQSNVFQEISDSTLILCLVSDVVQYLGKCCLLSDLMVDKFPVPGKNWKKCQCLLLLELAVKSLKLNACFIWTVGVRVLKDWHTDVGKMMFPFTLKLWAWKQWDGGAGTLCLATAL